MCPGRKRDAQPKLGSSSDGEGDSLPFTALQAAGDLAYALCQETGRLQWSGRAAAFFGPEGEPPATGEALLALVHADDLAARARAFDLHRGGDAYACSYRLRAGDGSYVWYHDRGALGPAEDGRVCLFGTLRRLGPDGDSEDRLLRLLTGEPLIHDTLTGHFNREHLLGLLAQTCAAADPQAGVGAFLTLDIDNFAQINAGYGHMLGNSVLAEVGRRLSDSVAADEALGRIGGDRFGLILPGVDRALAARRAEACLALFRDRPIKTASGEIPITVSVGVACFAGIEVSAAEVVACAEEALLQAKDVGRDCYLIYNDMPSSERSDSRADLRLAWRLRRAVNENDLLLVYQPVVCASSKQIRYYECLVRLRDDDGNLLEAGDFIPTAERHGIIRAVDRRVFQLAITCLQAEPSITLAINVSGLTIIDDDWLNHAEAELRAHPGLAQRLIVEITETASPNIFEAAVRFVARLKALGCRVAIDDFGAGYTSFRHLSTLGADIVKIDGAFVENVDRKGESQVFVRSLLDLAQFLGLTTVGERVETKGESEFLVAAGADLLQGFYYGEPRPWPDCCVAATGKPAAVPAESPHD